MSRDLVLIACALMTWGLGEGMFYFFQPLYLQELGADPLKIGSILGLVGLATMLAYLPAGYLSDRIGRRPLIWTGLDYRRYGDRIDGSCKIAPCIRRGDGALWAYQLCNRTFE